MLLLTGVTGFIGSTVLAQLLARNINDVLLLVRARSLEHACERVERYLAPHGVGVERDWLRDRVLVADLTRPNEYANDARFLRCRRVLHVAANTYFGSRYDDGQANIVGARLL